MKLQTTKKIIVIVFLVLFFSCKKNTSEKESEKQDENYITVSQANKVALNFSALKLNISNKSKSSTVTSIKEVKSIENIINIKAKDGTNAFYIVNYKEGGWVITSADRRTPSVLAYSDKGIYTTNNVSEGVS